MLFLFSYDSTTEAACYPEFPPLMPPYDAILFDFDGVLLDSEPLHCACWAEVLAPFGVNLAWDEYGKRYVGMDVREMLRLIAAQTHPPLDWNILWSQYPAKKE